MCAGVAEYFNVDPVLVRIAAVVLAISGPGVIAYVLAWIFVPAAEEPLGPLSEPPSAPRDRGTQILGIVLLAIAVSVLWGGWWSPARRWMFPLGLMALGVWLLLRREPSETVDAPHGARIPAPPASPPTTGWVAPAAAEVQVPDGAPGSTTPAGGPSTGPDDMVVDRDSPTATLGLPPTGPGRPAGGEGPPAPPWGFGPPPGTPGANGVARRRRRLLGPIVLGTLLVWSGVAWLAGISVETALAVGLCIVGVGFVFGAFVGGSWGLIVPAVLIAGALLVASITDIPLSGPVGDRTWTPRTIAQVDERYELSMGEGTLDLSSLVLDRGDRLAVEAAVGLGHLVVEVPAGVTVEVSAEASAGETLLLGVRDSGVGVSTDRTFPGSTDAGTIVLDLQVGFGQIEVREVRTTTPRTTPTTVLGSR